MTTLCPLCHRPLGLENIDRHHLVPKSRKGKVQEPIHKICHRKIHATYTEKELEKRFHTWEELRAQEPIKVFIEWVKDKDPGFYLSTRETADRRGKRR
jgi:hypothetical protein